jgi:hypothetical protein
MALAQEMTGEVRADEAGATGEQDVHALAPLIIPERHFGASVPMVRARVGAG